MSNDLKSFLNGGGAIVLLTACFYLFAYKFEEGYADYFGIPQEVIKITQTSLIAFGLAIVTALLNYQHLFPKIAKKRKGWDHLKNYFSWVILISLLFMPIFIIHKGNTFGITIATLLYSLILALHIIPPFYLWSVFRNKYKTKKGLYTIFLLKWLKRRPMMSLIDVKRISLQTEKSVADYTMLIVLLLFFPYYLGYITAYQKTSFLCTDDGLIMLKCYEDSGVFAKRINDGTYIDNNLIIKNITNLKEGFSTIKTGRIKKIINKKQPIKKNVDYI